jgi:hypothetical protein
VQTNGPCSETILFCAVSGTNVFAGTSNGVFLSSDSGTSWNQVNSGLTDMVVNGLAVSGTNLFACINNGVWRRPLSQLIKSFGSTTSKLPQQFLLQQNYPNPFNPTTTIKYQLPAQSHVTLKVFDVLGREVATLLDGVEQAGYKSVTFDASRLSSSVYFYRLQAGNYIETKKLLLLR